MSPKTLHLLVAGILNFALVKYIGAGVSNYFSVAMLTCHSRQIGKIWLTICKEPNFLISVTEFCHDAFNQLWLI